MEYTEWLECQGCQAQYRSSDAEDFEKYCSALCESEARVEKAGVQREQLKDSLQDEELKNRENYLKMCYPKKEVKP